MIQAFAKKYLDGDLKAVGFAKQGLIWNRPRRAFVDVVTIQTSKGSIGKSKPSITGNLAIVVPEFISAIFGTVPGKLSEAHGILRARFGDMVQSGDLRKNLDKWWDLGVENPKEVGEEIQAIVGQKVLPFFDSINEFQELKQFLEVNAGWSMNTPPIEIMKALVYWKTGDESKCDQILENASKGWSDKVQEVRMWMKSNSSH